MWSLNKIKNQIHIYYTILSCLYLHENTTYIWWFGFTIKCKPSNFKKMINGKSWQLLLSLKDGVLMKARQKRFLWMTSHSTCNDTAETFRHSCDLSQQIMWQHRHRSFQNEVEYRVFGLASSLWPLATLMLCCGFQESHYSYWD